MSNANWLRELGDLLSAFPRDQAPSRELFAEIQHVVDETIISVLESGGQLPAFILQAGRIEAIRKRLGEKRVAELAAKPLPPADVAILIPLAVQLCSAFDAFETGQPFASPSGPLEGARDQVGGPRLD